ncbi:hypothetical protein LZD49_13445 [Dyadobacter sp. CY261]|uniref:hypothetical protein n=1 Tax=Dyadobacter sp. CY261 TaxID=2907203 RepID=UPI001F2C36EB|nr:hypothetical protein [Dyadobacter sp. CY261]MCF0071480.1 hypothetical protein [Dyadobacter sp. CY261]
MRKIFLIILLLVSVDTFSQKGIEYTFPKEVTDSLTSFINQNSFKKHYIVMDKTSPSIYNIMVLPLQKVNRYIKQTNRYVKVNKKKIPIIFMTDTDFFSKGIGVRGGIIRTAVMYHGFTIHFNYSGEILRE